MEAYFAFLGLILVLWIIWRKHHLSVFKRHGIPGPEPNILLGNMLELYKKGAIQCQDEWVKEHGRVLGYFYGMKPILLVADPEILKNVFIKDFQKFNNREPFNPILNYDVLEKSGHSIINLRDKVWKDIRSAVTPTFTTAKMKKMTSNIKSSTETLITVMKEHAKSEKTFDIHDTYRRVAIDSITKVGFGVRTDVQTNLKSNLPVITASYSATTYRNPLIFIGLCFPYLASLCLWAIERYLRIHSGGLNPKASLQEYVKKIIDNRLKNPQGEKDFLQIMIDSKIHLSVKEEKSNHSGADDTKDEPKTTKDNTSMTFRKMTEDEIISNAGAFLTIGAEAVAVAMTFCTYLISKHQDVQQKLYEEINTLIQEDQNLGYSTITKLQYLDKVIKECLRIFPPAILGHTRFSAEDVQYGNFKIPKGVLVQGSVYLLHHDHEFWKDPEKFDPERFNNQVNSNGIIYMPFGVGPRSCLGMRYSMMEMKLFFAHLLHKFKFTLLDEDNMELCLRLRSIAPKKMINMKVELRQDE